MSYKEKRREFEKSGSALINHSLNQGRMKLTRDGERRIDWLSKKLQRSFRRRHGYNPVNGDDEIVRRRAVLVFSNFGYINTEN